MGREVLQAQRRGIQKPRHLLAGFTLDAHGQAERANLQIRHRAVQHLAEQIRCLIARDGSRALLAASDDFDVLTDAHTLIVGDR